MIPTPASDRRSQRGGGASISVQLLSGKSIRFAAEASDTVGMVKLKIQESEGIPPKQQRLTYQGGELDDPTKTLREMGIRHGGELFLSRPSPSLAYSKNKSPKKKFEEQFTNRRTKEQASTDNRASNLAPIYDWEKGGATSYDSPKRVAAQYKLDEPLEFQIQLTEKEFFKLTSRRRSIRAEKRHKERREKSQNKESPFLQSTGPYVDPMRITSSIYRSPNKSKWYDQKRPLRPYQHL